MDYPVRSNRLIKTNRTDAVLFGVCGGVAKYLGMDSTVVRVLTAITFVLTGFFPIAVIYLVMSFIMPREYSF